MQNPRNSTLSPRESVRFPPHENQGLPASPLFLRLRPPPVASLVESPACGEPCRTTCSERNRATGLQPGALPIFTLPSEKKLHMTNELRFSSPFWDSGEERELGTTAASAARESSPPTEIATEIPPVPIGSGARRGSASAGRRASRYAIASRRNQFANCGLTRMGESC